MISIDYYINRRLISVVSVLCVPYMAVILINNFFAVNLGFFKISSEVIEMLLLGIGVFFLGSLSANFRKRVSKTKRKVEYGNSENKFSFYKMPRMLCYVVAVEAMVIFRLVSIVRKLGVSFISTSDFEGLLLRGIMGHIFLTIYPLIPIIIFYWLKNKKKYIYLIAGLGGVVLLFFTFVKYHVIGMIVLIYLFCAFEDHKYIKKGAVFVTIMAIVTFISNYFLTFLLRGVTDTVGTRYYIEHLWNYISGSIIYANQIFQQGVREGTGIFYKVGSFVFSPLNLFLDKIAGFKLCPHIALPFKSVGYNGEKGNVIDAIGYLYPSKGSVIQIAGFIFVLFCFGVLFSIIYNSALLKRNKFSITLCTFLTFFVFFSFFGTFYISITPWEILIWSMVIPYFFDRRIKIHL